MTKTQTEILLPLVQELTRLNAEAATLKAGDELNDKLKHIQGFTRATEMVEQGFENNLEGV